MHNLHIFRSVNILNELREQCREVGMSLCVYIYSNIRLSKLWARDNIDSMIVCWMFCDVLYLMCNLGSCETLFNIL